MTGRTEGKIVVVTGAARGQGRTEAEHLAREGAHVWVTDILDKEGQQFVDGWSGPGSLTYHRVDVTSEADWVRLREVVAARHSRVDGLVNNAGLVSRDRLPNVDISSLNACLAVNVAGPLIGLQTLFPLMRRGASIVNIVSVAGLSGYPLASYTASKWALRGLTRAASLELGSLGIRVNAVFPGLIETPMIAGIPTDFRDAATRDTPLGRLGSVEDIAPLIVYLISDESGYVNGAEIVVDGGMTAHVSAKGMGDSTKSVS